MSEITEEDPTKEERAALSVSAAMNLARNALQEVVVKLVGEVSEVSIRPGYKAAYFTVKDEEASLPCMMWNNRYKATGITLEVGQLVQLTGRFTLYAAKGRMNFEVFAISLAGEGDLRLKVANIAKKLQAEGLTDPSRKLAIPAFPQSIGLVTSPRSAAVHDVLRTLRRRFPIATVYLAGVPVEGPHAAEGIVEGMRAVYRKHPDVMLIVRGGGSFEDLMPFNDEALARAIVACPIPVVTGIGHEVDTTIADMVSDFRASTPTGAAEAVSPSAENLQALFQSKAQALTSGVQRQIQRSQADIQRVRSHPLLKDPYGMLMTQAQSIDVHSERLARALPTQMRLWNDEAQVVAQRLQRLVPGQLHAWQEQADRQSNRFKQCATSATDRFAWQISQAAARLQDLSPLNVIARGYSITRTQQGGVVKVVEQAPAGSRVKVTVSNGDLHCVVENTSATDTPA